MFSINDVATVREISIFAVKGVINTQCNYRQGLDIERGEKKRKNILLMQLQ